jgi:hypothetical protein
MCCLDVKNHLDLLKHCAIIIPLATIEITRQARRTQAQSEFFDPYSIRVVISYTTSYILEQADLIVNAYRFTIRTACQGWGPFTWLQGDSRDHEEKLSSQVCAIDHFLAFSIPDTLIWRGVMKIPYLQEHDIIGRMDRW